MKKRIEKKEVDMILLWCGRWSRIKAEDRKKKKEVLTEKRIIRTACRQLISYLKGVTRESKRFSDKDLTDHSYRIFIWNPFPMLYIENFDGKNPEIRKKRNFIRKDIREYFSKKYKI